MSRLTEANYAADRARRKMLRSAGPVLIDAAHNFRNNSPRRRTLPNFLKSGQRRRPILLSATPQNLAPRDILRQPELFPDPVHHGLAGIAGDLRRYFLDAAVDAGRRSAAPPAAAPPLGHRPPLPGQQTERPGHRVPGN